MNEFSSLSNAEKAQIYEAPLLVTLLVGAADGKFDREEKTWSSKLVQAKTYSKPENLRPFWENVAADFLEKIESLAANLHGEVAARNEMIAAKLSNLNGILAKLDGHTAYFLYKSLIGLAEETAKASGGFLRIGSVSAAEYRWVKLPMVHPISRPENLAVFEEDEDEKEDN